MKPQLLMCLSMALLVTSAGCADETLPPDPPSFERPGSVAFVCVANLADGSFKTLAPTRCRSDDPTDGVALHALVTQTSRGEVAVVDLESQTVLDSRLDIPGFSFIPVGEFPSAIVVGSIPADPDNDEEEQGHDHTYVSNFGSRDVTVVNTASLLDLPPGADPAEQTVAIELEVDGELRSGGPTDMVLSPDGDALFVSVPELGAVLRLPLRHPCGGTDLECIDTDNIQAVRTAASLDRLPAVSQPPPQREAYQFQCGGYQPPLPQRPVELDPAMADRNSEAFAGKSSQPVAMAIDDRCPPDQECTRRLLVADRVLPIIHVIDVDGFPPGSDASGALLDPIIAGAPTRQLAVTPLVPATAGADEGTIKYVYAIDGSDGSVLVFNDGQLLSPNVDPTGRADRVPLGVTSPGSPSATSIEVITPYYEEQGSDRRYVGTNVSGGGSDLACLDENFDTQDPRRLRGVFLTVALTDGSVRVIDIHDMELNQGSAQCAVDQVREVNSNTDDTDAVEEANKPRQTELSQGIDLNDNGCPCRQCPILSGETARAAPILLRHHPRLDENFLPPSSSSPARLPVPSAVAAQVVSDGQPFRITEDGTTSSESLPGLKCLACPTGDLLGDDAGTGSYYEQAYPDLNDTNTGSSIASPDAGVFMRSTCDEATPSLVCAARDPWHETEDSWVFWYEGRLPDSDGSRGNFVSPNNPLNQSEDKCGDSCAADFQPVAEFHAEIDFCQKGVIGKDDVADELPGDKLVLTVEELPEDEEIEAFLGTLIELDPDFSDLSLTDTLERCQAWREALELDAAERPEVSFNIRRSYRTHVVISESVLQPFPKGPRDYRQVSLCLGKQLTEYEIRVQDAYLVDARRSTFRGDLELGPADRCLVPSEEGVPPSRAYPGRLFDNGTLLLEITEPRSGEDLAAQGEVFFEVGLRPSASKVFYSALLSNSSSVMPVKITYSPLDHRLYLIDNQVRGLVPIELNPMRTGSSLQFH